MYSGLSWLSLKQRISFIHGYPSSFVPETGYTLDNLVAGLTLKDSDKQRLYKYKYTNTKPRRRRKLPAFQSFGNCIVTIVFCLFGHGTSADVGLPVSVRLQVSPPKPSAQMQMKGSSPTAFTHVPPFRQRFTSQ